MILTFVDLETTGLDLTHDFPVEIGAAKYDADTWQNLGYFSMMLKPPFPIPAAATKIHGITDAMVANATDAVQGMAAFWYWNGHAHLCGHNLRNFDYPIIERVLRMSNMMILVEIYDTMEIVKAKVPEFSTRNLTFLCQEFGIERRAKHRALDDAMATAKVYRRLMQ